MVLRLMAHHRRGLLHRADAIETGVLGEVVGHLVRLAHQEVRAWMSMSKFMVLRLR